MSKIAIKVEGISKAYRIGVTAIRKDDTFMSRIKMLLSKPVQNFKKVKGLSNISDKNIADDDIYMALSDVSFELKEGEVLGIIGKNGAGKSTLLKILSRIVQPTAGRIEMFGRVASLLEVGTGFNPDLTGNENIYLNGTILGLTKKEIDARYKSIVEFSGIEQFIETPVKRYSSGMKVRLAFAVAAHLDPEILVIDEVLAVGDAEFQQKCISKMQDVANKEGRTVLFVSHDMAAVKKLCTRAILLQKGKLVKEGLPEEVIEYYYRNTSVAQASNLNVLNKDNRVSSDGRFTIEAYELLDEKGNVVQTVECGSDISIRLHYKTTAKGYNPVVLLRVKNNMDEILFNCLSRNSYGSVMKLNSEGYIDCHIPKLPLLAGVYSIDICLKYQSEITDEILSGIRLQVERGDFFGTGKMNEDYVNGIVVQHNWVIN
jgi:lipopolysaccharide transport system ATP-binding protein